MTDAEIAEARERIQDLREEVRADLAEDLGGDPDDYRSERYFRDLGGDTDEAVPDGGE
jgi:hypothetical protein